jgi:uncharacterized RDD family membrane protein YckC
MSENNRRETENYRVVFLGLVDSSDAQTEAFAEKLSATLKIPTEKALKIARKAPIVVKKGVSRTKAERYQQFFVRLGGQVRIETAELSDRPIPPIAAPPIVEGLETTAFRDQEATPHRPESLPGEPAMAETVDEDVARAYEEGFAPPGGGRSASSRESGFNCPQCGHKQEKTVECLKCGIIFEKHERMTHTLDLAENETSQTLDEENTVFQDSAPADFEVTIEPAGFWIRVGAYIVDYLVFGLAVLALGVIFFFLLGGMRSLAAVTSVAPTVSWIVAILFFAYHIYFVGSRGYTPGKGFLGLQIIRQDGTGMSYGDAAIRSFSYILSSIVLNLGFLWIGFDRKKQGWHDKIAKTQVIRAEEVSSWRKWIILVPAVLIPLIGIVASIGIPVYSGYASRAEVAKAVSEMHMVKNHLEEHFYRYDRYPRTGEFRAFLVNTLGRIPMDPFDQDRPYRYESDGSAFILWSIGPDQVDNGANISYDPLLKRGFKRQGDIILYSDEAMDQTEEMFGRTLEGADQVLNFSY